MPKAKPNKSIKKRFKLTGTGKLLRRKQGRSHLLTKKSSARKRRLGTAGLVPECFVKTFTRLIVGQ